MDSETESYYSDYSEGSNSVDHLLYEQDEIINDLREKIRKQDEEIKGLDKLVYDQERTIKALRNLIKANLVHHLNEIIDFI